MLALTFQAGPDRVAVDVRRVREVVPRVPLTPAAGTPDWVAGVFVYRGRVVPVIDLYRLTGAGPCPARPPEPPATTGSLFGPAVADGAGVVHRFDPDRFLSRPAIAAGLTAGAS